MSIYRSKYNATRLLSNDVYARGPAAPPVEIPIAPPQRLANGDEHKRRRGEPANVPLRPTLNWVEGLPPNVRPTALLRRYARIANIIAATWYDPKAFKSYTDGLFRDDRGNRKGFPPDVHRELLALREYHAEIHMHAASN